jgi:heme A synthase
MLEKCEVSYKAMTAGKYLVYVTIISIFVVFISGAYLSGSGFGAACGVGGTSLSSSDWPFCNGSLGFPSKWPAQVEYVHRLLSICATVLLVVSNLAVWIMKPRPTAAARALLLALVLLLLELYLGGAVINANLNVVIGTISLATATTVFGVLVVAGDRIYLHEKKPSRARTEKPLLVDNRS